jgi:uncharacterized protein YcfJ
VEFAKNLGINMKRIIFLTALTLSSSVYAQQFAEVIRVEPRMVTVQQQQCQEIQVQVPGSSGNAAGGVLGAIAGAALGNQVGGGSGKDIATVVGGVVGYQVGRGEPTPPTTQTRVQCNMVPIQLQRGEIVTFRYNNRVFTQTFE